MLNKNLALITLVVFAAGCGLEARTYVMTKPRVGLGSGNGNGGCFMGKCSPAPTPTETTRKVYVLEITKPFPESEVQKIEETAVNAITETTPSATDAAPVETAPATEGTGNISQPAAAAQPVVPVVGEEPGTAAAVAPDVSTATPATQNGGSMQAQTYTVQKDDTLQKISKKLFGTYGKWYKIYETNKDKIKNPNILQPGTVLNIPAMESDNAKKGN